MVCPDGNNRMPRLQTPPRLRPIVNSRGQSDSRQGRRNQVRLLVSEHERNLSQISNCVESQAVGASRSLFQFSRSHQFWTYPRRSSKPQEWPRLMARFSVAQTDNEDQTIADINWEEESYQQGFAFAREQARLSLEALDAELLRGKPKGWTVLSFLERTMVTKFGEEVIRRRLYRDPDGQSRFALDEHFGWESHQQASPSLTESIVTLSAQMPPYQVRGRLFGKTATTVSALTAGVLQARRGCMRGRTASGCPLHRGGWGVGPTCNAQSGLITRSRVA